MNFYFKLLKLLRPTSLRLLLSVRQKFILVLTLSFLWFILCVFLSGYWVEYLSRAIGLIPAMVVVLFIALIPGFMNFFLTLSYLLNKRPTTRLLEKYPGISILIAAYNEEQCITSTLESVIRQVYPGEFEIIVIDDGSQDQTVELIKPFLDLSNVRFIQGQHAGKANALNLGLQYCQYDLVATIDADTYLLDDSLYQLVARLVSESSNTVAVAGSVHLKNGDVNYLTKLQWWDYFNAIQAVKHVQSFFKGTLVAQGAFSLYKKAVLVELGGWPDAIGEDIVLTWKMLALGYETSYAEDAIVFTNAPESYKKFFYQRSRWARGLLEAFRMNPKILLQRRLSTFMIYWNLLFPIMDFAYLFILTPGIIAAFFGYYYIAGPMTLAVLPLAVLQNLIFSKSQRKIFKLHGLSARKNSFTFVFYLLFYNFFMCPACVHGYVSYWLGLRKIWGTK
jgi:biofilm PGA synthesis N-glycosyltransferase PgaC